MEDDWREFIETLRSQKVEFMVVGAHALASFGRPRYTEDLDVFLRRSDENKLRLSKALVEFGIPLPKASVDRLFAEERQMVVLGHEPYAIDLLTFLDGVDFEGAYTRRTEAEVFGVMAPVISLSDYVATKKACGRPKDEADLALLREVTGD